MLLQEHSSLCIGENGKPFCLARLWPAIIVRIHWDFTINAVHAFQNTKKYILVSHTRPLKFIYASRKDKHFIDSIKCRCVNSGMTGRVGGFQNRGVCLQALPSCLPHPSPLFYLCHFSRGLCLLFLVLYSKPHRNACYAGLVNITDII